VTGTTGEPVGIKTMGAELFNASSFASCVLSVKRLDSEYFFFSTERKSAHVLESGFEVLTAVLHLL
jgi:hypothetical protein